jgi:hypothetical protein
LDVNFNTPVTIGNTTVGLGNTVTSFGNVTLTNTTISGLSGGSANGVVYINSSNVAVASPSVLTFDGTNLGLGVTPSAWDTSYKVVEAGYGGNAFLGSTGQVQVGVVANGYWNGGWKYKNSTYATLQLQQSGQHQWWNAPSGNASSAITFTQAMTLDINGALLVGTTSNPGNGYKLLVATGGNFGLGVTTNNTVYMSALGTGTVYSNGGILTNTNPSDERLKENITNVSWGLEQISALRPVSYTWKNNPTNQGTQYGFIAQEVQAVMPELVREFETRNGEEVVIRFGLEKDGIYATMVKAIQELSAQVTTLQTQVTALQAKVGV